MISKNKLKKVSKRVREGQQEDQDKEIIEAFVIENVPRLVSISDYAEEVLSKSDVGVIVAGRAKRHKSIVRKLARMPGCNLATMADIVGIRIVVRDMRGLRDVQRIIGEALDVRDTKDYLKGQVSGYRAVHLYVEWMEAVVEIQLRTLAQQLWAVESETFGERVKEGGGGESVRTYLKELSEACRWVDETGQMPSWEINGEVGRRRGALQGRLPLLYWDFDQVQPAKSNDRLFVLVFDNQVTDLLSVDGFGKGHVNEATQYYSYKARLLDDERFDVVLINSISQSVMRVSHSNFFPSRAGV